MTDSTPLLGTLESTARSVTGTRHLAASRRRSRTRPDPSGGLRVVFGKMFRAVGTGVLECWSRLSRNRRW